MLGRFYVKYYGISSLNARRQRCARKDNVKQKRWLWNVTNYNILFTLFPEYSPDNPLTSSARFSSRKACRTTKVTIKNREKSWEMYDHISSIQAHLKLLITVESRVGSRATIRSVFAPSLFKEEEKIKEPRQKMEKRRVEGGHLVRTPELQDNYLNFSSRFIRWIILFISHKSTEKNVIFAFQ